MKFNEMKNIQRSSFKLNPLAASIALALATQFAITTAHANGGGYGPNTDISGATIDVQTFYASSPQGSRPAYDFKTHTLSTTGATIDTGKPLRKFVDPLGGVYNGLEPSVGSTGIDSGLPVAIKEKWFNPITKTQTNDDYLEIAIVEYTQQMHSDLPKQTRLRGYVQIETPNLLPKQYDGLVGLTDITSVVGSEHIQAFYPDGVTPILDAAGKQVYFVHKPHYLGPVILASRGTPIRMKYTNYLPYHDKDGISIGSHNGTGGELNIPVDRFILGGGPTIDKNGQPIEFTQNRASIHWHGGDSPWISDGTPHQWIVPAGETRAWDAGIGHGASFQNVPDMPDPGPGSGTMYFPNNLSGRLMMYHDHVSGLTKLNVYVGEAAGYVVYDMIELGLVADAIGVKNLAMPTGTLESAVPLLDTVGIPLVFQDKTFVPKNIGPVGGSVTVGGVTSTVTQSQDAKWNLTHWGQPGDLWFPHVYETNQDPNSADGTNPTGRWDWGPWFWPVFPSEYSLPTGEYGDVTQTPEAFMDTSLVNGQAYPTMTVDPKTYRFRILSVANDRSVDLSLFQAVDAMNQVCDSSNTTPALAPAQAGGDAPVACTEIRMVPAVPTPGFPATWPTDGRAGGVPDPTTAGPDFVQIGSEGGLLPAVAVIKAHPVSYDLDKRSITILNVLNHGLFLGGGERADVLVDFTKYAGQTLIMYNDAPTPMPAVDPRTDYFTGMGDMTDAGGAYDPLPGYGPSTRTVMQIKVNATNTSNTGGPLNVAALKQALPVAYAKSQPTPIIPQAVYNAPFGTNNVDNYAQIRTGGNSQPYFLMSGDVFAITGLTLTNGGSGYVTAPLVTLSAPPAGGTQATATATITGGKVTGLTLDNPGAGYTNTAPLTATFSAPGAGGRRASAKVDVNAFKVINKAIQELFEPVYGRMNATLAVELPFSSALVATTIPLAYLDAPIDNIDGIKDGETQVWKITHNGVDSHPVHFHLVNVQVINRVDWAGVVKPPAANELGWKETLMMNPLEDIYVAARAVRPVVPFGLPKSARTMDPTQGVGQSVGFTQVDQLTGQAPTFQTQLVNGVSVDVPTPNGRYTNQMTDFDNEYVWHCHILGHEENDFMRPFIFHPTVIRPDAPVITSAPNASELIWTDPTPAGGWDADGVPTAGTTAFDVINNTPFTVEPTNNAKNEIGFIVKDAATGLEVKRLPANATSWTVADTALTYQVVAYNVAGESQAGVQVKQVAPVAAGAGAVSNVPVAAASVAPTGVTQTKNADGTVTLSWVAVPGATSYIVTSALNGVQTVQTVSATTATLASVTGNAVTVAAVVDGVTGDAASLFNGIAYAPIALTTSNGATGAIGKGTITLTWANDPRNVNNVTGITLTWGLVGSAVTQSQSFAAAATGASLIGLSADKDYTISLVANGPMGNSVAVTKMVLSAP
jgi:FtsP/CotA-like multicopper oxidase with cupredoxin domain